MNLRFIRSPYCSWWRWQPFAVADSKNSNKLSPIFDFIQDTVEVRLLAIDELTNGSVVVSHNPHAGRDLQLQDEICQAVEPTGSRQRLLGIDVSVESGQISNRAP